MGRKKIDKKIIELIASAINRRYRCLFFVFGTNSKHQVLHLHHVLVKQRNLSGLQQPSVLWCYKKEVEFNVHFQEKKLKLLRKHYAVADEFDEKNMMHHFLLSSVCKFCHYSQTDTVLGQTFGMLILQDFEAVTPNILARTLECVEGGGAIVVLLPNVQSLEDVFSLPMDAHDRYITEAHSLVHPLFNKRLILSLQSCPDCIVLDDSLRIRLCPNSEPDGTSINKTENSTEKVQCPSGSEHLGKLSNLTCTTDQLAALQKIYAVLDHRERPSVVSLTSARGRGKSALLGLATALALCGGHSNVCVTSPHVENVQTFFQFLTKGLNSLGFTEGASYKVLKTDADSITCMTGIRISGNGTRKVSYHRPTDWQRAQGSDLIVIDEAAAIPLTVVQMWMQPCTVMMASTVNGYEGTGRSLSLKLVNDLRNPCRKQSLKGNVDSHSLHELTLNEAIRYANGDNVEAWLNHLLCLEASLESSFFDHMPAKPEDCELYYVNREVLFGYNKMAEKFLQQLTLLFVSSHYKNSPNDLMMAADAPAHQLLCLLPQQPTSVAHLPPILCVVQLAYEGQISEASCQAEHSEGRRAFGDLIPWIISQQFQDMEFPTLKGARIVRIATHPSYQRLGYGLRTLQLLSAFCSASKNKHKSAASSDGLESSSKTSSLLLPLKSSPITALDYLGVSFGLTTDLFQFWKKAGFIPLYIRQTTSDVTGEHSCIMLKSLHEEKGSWLESYFMDFRERFTTLLMSCFRKMPSELVLSILHVAENSNYKDTWSTDLSPLSDRSFRRVRAYCLQQVDYHLILDLLPILSRPYFMRNRRYLSSAQESVLLCMGLQFKNVEEAASELDLEGQQVLGCFRRAVQMILERLTNIPSIDNKVHPTKHPENHVNSSHTVFQKKRKRN